VSISSMFYEQLLSRKRKKILIHFWDLCAHKAACKTLMKLTPGRARLRVLPEGQVHGMHRIVG